MDRLVSKIIAGGLSAGVFLFWWPEHVAGDGLLQLVLRGLLWTLSFELLLITLGPAEQLIERRVRARAIARGESVRTRLAGVPAPARTGGVVALACCGLAAPLALIADAPKQLVNRVERPQVVKQVIVERPVIEKKIVVRRVVAPAAQQPLHSAGAAPSVATSARPVARKAATVAPERTASTRATAKTETTATTTAPKAQTGGSTTTATTSVGAPASGTQSGDTAPAAASTTPAE